MPGLPNRRRGRPWNIQLRTSGVGGRPRNVPGRISGVGGTIMRMFDHSSGVGLAIFDHKTRTFAFMRTELNVSLRAGNARRGAQRAVECGDLSPPSLKRLVAPSPWQAVAGATTLSRQVARGIPIYRDDKSQHMLNLINNAFYAVNEKKKRNQPGSPDILQAESLYKP